MGGGIVCIRGWWPARPKNNLDAGVISPCVSVGAWKSATLGLNHSLMATLAAQQGGGSISDLPLWQVWGAATSTPCLDHFSRSSQRFPALCAPCDVPYLAPTLIINRMPILVPAL